MNGILRHVTGRAFRGIAIAAFVFLAAASSSYSQITQLSQYIFSAGIGTPTDMSSAATAIGQNFDDGVAGTFNIGFNFVFCGNTYSQFTVSSNGYMGLGGTFPFSYLSGCFTTDLGAPIIAGFWRDMYTANGGVTYLTTGNSPNRVLTVQWSANACCSGGTPGTQFQIRLYEGSNKFDMWYGASNVSCGTIGAALNSSNWASVTTPSSVSYTSCNSCNNSPAVNTVYTFSQCTITYTGNVSQGGTTSMAYADTLLTGMTVQRGNSVSYNPMTVTGPGCGPTALTFTITGDAAADYTINPSSTNVQQGSPVVPTITFNPQGNGKRLAKLTGSAPGQVDQVFYLAATATPRIQFSGNIPQGGTASVINGDTLMSNLAVTRGQSQNFTPVTLTNINTNGAAPGAMITYTIKGTSGGQYSISPGSSVVTAGQSVSPVITFSPTGVGAIVDTLTINAEGDVRVYALRANSIAPGGNLQLNTIPLDSNSALFREMYGCLGEEVVSYPLEAVSNGYGLPFNITSVEFYSIDTTYRQGQPTYPFMRDASGMIVRSTDYALSTSPTVAPLSTPSNNVNYPISLQPGAGQRMYLSFVGQRPGKRFARIVVRTNAQNIFGRDTNGVLTQGLLTFDLYARGRNASLSDNINGGLPKAIEFPNTKVGQSATKNVTLVNAGQCTLRVSMKDLQIIAGDQKEFQIVGLPTTNIDPATNDLVIAPGQSNTGIVVKFTPQQTGSRRATLVMWTNDSTVSIPGHTRPGAYYLDLYGYSPAMLNASSLDLGTVLIGGTGAEQHHGVIHLENTSNLPLDITKILVDGADSLDFSQDGGAPWPTLPALLQPGERLDLAVIFAPASGNPGSRSGHVKLVLSSGDTVIAPVTGVAGTRMVAVNPTSMTFDLKTTRSGYSRQTVTITNVGTMLLTIDKPVISGGGASDFSLGSLPRLDLQPGQSEYLEVTYHATTPGNSTASLRIAGNQTNGPQIISLNGTATKARLDDMPTSVTSPGREDAGFNPIGSAVQGTADVNGDVSVDGMVLHLNVPNPGRDMVTIGYQMPTRSNVRLELFDGNGRLVRILDEGMREAGETTVQVDVTGLAGGVYHYRLIAGGHTLNRSMTVVH